jgi:hypothetical protein
MRVSETTTAEVAWLAGAIVLIVLLIEAPHSLAYAQEGHGFVFSGLLWWSYDFAQYAAAIREGATSQSWLIHDHLTGEAHRPVFMYPLYVGLGKLAELIGLDPRLGYRALALISRVSLLGALYLFCGAIYSTVRARRVAFVLIVFSSGLGVWLLLLRSVVPYGFANDQDWTLAVDMKAPEVTTFLLFFTAPHLMLGLALQLLGGVFYLRSWSEASLRPPLLTGVVALGLGLTNPFGLVTFCTVLVVHVAVARLGRHGLLNGPIVSVSAAIVAAAPSCAYALLTFGADPFWGTVYGRQNMTFSPSPLLLTLGFAPILTLAALGLVHFTREQAPGHRLIITWVLVILVLMYVPIGVQRRFALGLHPMLALIAVTGLERVCKPGRLGISARSPLRSLVVSTLLLALFASTIGTYGLMIEFARRPSPSVEWAGVFQPSALREAGRWLAGEMAPDDVVLAAPLTGNYLGGIVPGRVFIGHPVATLDYEGKGQATRRFYRGDDTPEHRQRFLASHNIRYVVYGPHERSASAAPLDGGYLRLAYATPDVSIFRVEGVGLVGH